MPQLVAHGEVRTLSALPSFLYFPTADELSAGAVSATWDEDPPMVTGVLAREQGALVPSRQVSSAKSWLSYPGVDRRAKILPAQAEPPQPMISPVEASARYLMHLRDAWNGAIGTDAETRFEHQEIVLTVPASFDEEARELTVEAARNAEVRQSHSARRTAGRVLRVDCGESAGAGASRMRRRAEDLRDGELILICDIGGGTTDFSLVRARLVDGELQFERTAIGEHLLLGGDNLDLALARRVEEKLKDVKLTLRQRYALRRACCAAKERLLSDSSLERVPVTVLGSGRAVIGQALSVELTREEVLQILTAGFLPITAPDEMPARGRLDRVARTRPALRRRSRHHQAPRRVSDAGGCRHEQFVGKPANGSTRCRALQWRILCAGGDSRADCRGNFRLVRRSPKRLAAQAPQQPSGRECGGSWCRLLRPRTARHRFARQGRQRAHLLHRLAADDGLQGICVLPAGIEEGTTLPLLNREFSVLANRPVSFTLYSSRTRHDAHGEVAALDEADIHRHAPLVSLLRYGKKMRELYLKVRLRASFTEVGTLELWCESRDTAHRWRLQFELRGEESQAQQLDTAKLRTASPPIHRPLRLPMQRSNPPRN